MLLQCGTATALFGITKLKNSNTWGKHYGNEENSDRRSVCRTDERRWRDRRAAEDWLQRLAGLGSSADEPGLIYDVLAVSPDSLAQNKGEWLKVLKVWYQAVDFLKDPATREEAISIMAARVGIPAEEYKGFIDGTKILTLEEALPFMEKSEGFKSLYGSSKIADVFNVANEVYADEQPVDSYIEASLMKALYTPLRERTARPNTPDI